LSLRSASLFFGLLTAALLLALGLNWARSRTTSSGGRSDPRSSLPSEENERRRSRRQRVSVGAGIAPVVLSTAVVPLSVLPAVPEIAFRADVYLVATDNRGRRLSRSYATDSTGLVEMELIDVALPISGRIIAEAEGYATELVQIHLEESLQPRTSIVLHRLIEVRGRVVRRDNSPVERARVLFVRPHQEATTNVNGRFSIVTDRKSALVILTPDLAPYSQERLPAAVDGEVVVPDIALSPGARIVVTIVGVDDASTCAARVIASLPQHPSLEIAGSDGSATEPLELAPLPTGSIDVDLWISPAGEPGTTLSIRRVLGVPSDCGTLRIDVRDATETQFEPEPGYR